MELRNFTNSSIQVATTIATAFVDFSSQSSYVNLTNLTTGELQNMTTTTPALACRPGTELCDDQNYCLHGGLCCLDYGQKLCVCHTGYTGDRCQNKDEGLLTELWETVKSQDGQIVQAGVSSAISTTLGLLALVACIILVIVLVRRKLLLNKDSEDYLEQHLTDIQQELDNMPTVSKLIQLTRLSKFFQQSARLAVETTVLSADVRRTVVNPSPHDACLPRWSSAPARLAGEGAPTDRRDDVDAATSPTWLAPSVRHQLQQVFSLDVGTLERSQQHLQQQQLLQQQLPSNDDDRTGSTRL